MSHLRRLIKAFKKKLRKIKRLIPRLLSKTPKRKFYYAFFHKHFSVKENMILVESFHGSTVSDSSLALVREILDSYPGKFKIYYGTQNKKEHSRFIRETGLDVELIDVTTFKYTKILATAKYLINNSSFPVYFIKKDEQVYIQTWHGTPLKTLGKEMRLGIESMYNVQHNFLQASYITFPNDFTKDVMMRDYNLNNLYTGKVVMAGYPRNEIFLRENEGSKLKAQLGLEGKTVYAYMPTWRGTSNHSVDTSAYEERVKEILKRIDTALSDNQLLFVNFHPILKSSISLDGYKHIKPFPSGVDNYAFLNCADALVTDYSSVFFDYSLTKKPIILFMYDYDEYMHDRGMYIDVAELPFRKIYDDRELAETLRDESFLSDSYEDTEYYKTFFKYDSPDISKKLIKLLFEGDESGLDITDYSFNTKRELKVIHPKNVKQYFDLNTIANMADENSVVCLEKKWFKKDVGLTLHDYFNDAFDYVVVTMTTPRTYVEDLLCHIGVKKVIDRVHAREIKRTFPNLNVQFDYIRDITAFAEECTVSINDVVNTACKVSNTENDICIKVNLHGYAARKLAILKPNRTIIKLIDLTQEEKDTGNINIPVRSLVENLCVYNNQKYLVGITAVDMKTGSSKLIVPSGSQDVLYEEPLINDYMLPASYFDVNLKKLIESDSDRHKEMLALYDLTPVSQTLAATPFYNQKGFLMLFFSKREEIMNRLYAGCKLMRVKVNGNHCSIKAHIPKDKDATPLALVLKYRSKTEEIEIPFKTVFTEKKSYTELSADIDFNPDMPLKEIYWDVRVVIEKFGSVQYLKLSYKHGFRLRTKFYFDNCQCDVDSSRIIFPYLGKGSVLCFCYREKSPYDTRAVRFKEFTAFVIYRLFKNVFNKKKIWIVYEKFCKMAQDNGYYFFRYCMENLPESERRRIFYVIDKSSPEYENVKKYDSQVIDFMSIKHMLYILSMEVCVSSDSKSHLYAWRTKPSVIKRGIRKKKELFLQHGVTALKKVHHLFGRNGSSPMAFFVTTGKVEQEIAVNELGYSYDTAPITGFARWDVLQDKSDKSNPFILLMPTWRSWLEEVSDETFVQSDYYRNYLSLLKSPRLSEILEKSNTRLVFYIHPKFASYIKNFDISTSSRISIVPFGQEPLNELMMKCSMLITDYSSVCWDVYYLDKPVLFYQFDYEKYNEAHGSYINMETGLFGSRSTKEEKLLNDIEHFTENGFEESLKDREMAPEYFEYRDSNNSKRIYEFLKNADLSSVSSISSEEDE